MIVEVTGSDLYNGATYKGEKVTYVLDEEYNLQVFKDGERVGIHAHGFWAHVKTVEDGGAPQPSGFAVVLNDGRKPDKR